MPWLDLTAANSILVVGCGEVSQLSQPLVSNMPVRYNHAQPPQSTARNCSVWHLFSTREAHFPKLEPGKFRWKAFFSLSEKCCLFPVVQGQYGPCTPWKAGTETIIPGSPCAPWKPKCTIRSGLHVFFYFSAVLPCVLLKQLLRVWVSQAFWLVAFFSRSSIIFPCPRWLQ